MAWLATQCAGSPQIAPGAASGLSGDGAPAIRAAGMGVPGTWGRHGDGTGTATIGGVDTAAPTVDGQGQLVVSAGDGSVRIVMGRAG